MTRAEPAPKTPPKWVFTFGAGRADGSAAERDRLGGKGAYLAEMSRLGLPVPPGFTISAEVCSVYYELGRKLPEELKPMVSAALDRRWQDRRRRIRRRRESAARLGALGLARLDARHDGHRAQSRSQRSDRRGVGAALAGPALRLRHLSPLHSDVCRRGARPRPRAVRGDPRELQKSQRLGIRYGAQRRGLGRHRRPLQDPGRDRARRALPARPPRPTLGRHRRRVRLLGECPRHRLSPPPRHSRRLGHRRYHPGHGVRQYG